MKRLPGWTFAIAVFCTASAAHAVAPDGVVAILPVQNPAADTPAARAVAEALRRRLESRARVVDPGRTRAALRRLRIRIGDDTPPDSLRRLGRELGAQVLISPTLHDVERRRVPRLALSARAYRADSGDLLWARFQGKSGRDGPGLLGTGRVRSIEGLVPIAVAALMSDEREPRQELEDADPGLVAIVTFDSVTDQRATRTAETATEAARAALHRVGARLVSPSCVGKALRHLPTVPWGGVSTPTREALQETCGAEAVLTGSVERYDVGGGNDPEPEVSVAVRLIDGTTGRILWMDGLERHGADREGLFRLGRVYSRGGLVKEMMETLMDGLLRNRRRASRVHEVKR